MTVETFFANFGHLADAPNGVQKLRELILQLAVRGKLVPQDANEPPARELQKEIDADKQRLVKAGKIKSPKPLPLITPEEVPYALPQGWEWKRLPDITFFQEGPGILKKDFRETGVPLIRISGMHTDSVSLDGCNFLDESMVDKKWSHFQLDLGDVVLSSSASLGKVSKVGSDAVGCIIYTGLIRFKPYTGLFEDFLIRFLSSDEFVRQINQSKTGAAIKHFGPSHLINMVIPFPPLAEQKRIVAKVDQLMALCDELEARQQKQQQGLVRLNNAALDALLNARDHGDFAGHWQRISTNFDLLYDHPETIAKLRAAILQLAVQGKLVPQDPKDEPAKVLLEKIKAEKERLVRGGRFKKLKLHLPVRLEEEPYQIPIGWSWVKLDALADIGTGTTPSKTNPLYYSDGNVPWVTSSATADDIIRDAETCVTDLAVKECRLRKYQPGTLVIALYGQGKTRGQVAELGIEATVNQACATIDVGDNFSYLKSYIRILLEKQYDELRELAAGGAQPNLNVGKIESILVPLPPQNEQKRIVSKVDHLMALCDALEAKLNQARLQGEKLMKATVRKLLGNVAPQRPHVARQSTRPADKMPASKTRKPYSASPEPAQPIAAEAPTGYSGNIPETILSHMSAGREYSRAELLAATGISEADWIWAIRQLKEQGRVVQMGERRGARYRNNEKGGDR